MMSWNVFYNVGKLSCVFRGKNIQMYEILIALGFTLSGCAGLTRTAVAAALK